jgi:hypothetical protein
MRPVDLLPAAAHAFYDQTFDNWAGAPMLAIGDFTWANAGAAAVAANNRLYHFFRNGTTWPPPAGARVPMAQPASMPIVPNTTRWAQGVMAPTVIPANAIAGWLNFDGTAPLTVNAQIAPLQKDTALMRYRVLRMLVPAIEACDLVRARYELDCNGLPAAVLDNAQRTALNTIVTATDTVPGIAAPAGTFYGYRGSIRDLERTLGRYCSYCEGKGQDGRPMEVEHRLAKAAYVSDILRWENFLLACPVCNQAKNPNPNRPDGISKAAQYYHGAAGIVYAPPSLVSPVIPPGPATIQYHEMRQACDEYYIWPSLDDGGPALAAPVLPNPANPTNYSLRCMRYRLREYGVALGLPRWIPDADAVNINNTAGDDQPDGTIAAMVWDSTLLVPAMRAMFVKVEAIAQNPATGVVPFDARKAIAAQETIDMCGLNDMANAVGDGRVRERTRTWFRAIEMLGLLRTQIATLNRWQTSWAIVRWFSTRPVVNFPQDLANIVASAAEGGYYSTWLAVFKLFGAANGLGGGLTVTLAQNLDARGLAAPNSPFRYRGSNLQNSVIAQIPHL